MTILHAQLDGAQDPRPTYPTPTPPTEIFGCTDPGEDVRAVVTVRVAMTRDMLATALDLAAGNCEEHPDNWSVAYIRESVELQLTYENFIELERTAQAIAEWELVDETVKPYMQAIYRAVDRAYPQPRLDRLERGRKAQERYENDPEYRAALIERIRATCTGSFTDESFGR